MLIPIINFDYWGLPIYNIMCIAGLAAALLTLIKNENDLKVDSFQAEKINGSFIAAVPIALLFANISNWFLQPMIFGYPIWQRFALGGFAFYYGMLGFFAASALFLRLRKQNAAFWLNEVVPSLLILHAFGRVGCSLAGCCYGVRIEPLHISGGAINRFPAREVEALCLFIMYCVFQFKIKHSRLFWYLLSYAAIRFFIEFGRGDDRGRLFSDVLSPAQVTSLAILGLLFIMTAYRRWAIYKHKR